MQRPFPARCASRSAHEIQEKVKREASEKSANERFEKEILELLTGGSMSQGDLLQKVQGKDRNKSKVLAQLVSFGRVQMQKQGKAFVYNLPDVPVEGVAA